MGYDTSEKKASGGKKESHVVSYRLWSHRSMKERKKRAAERKNVLKGLENLNKFICKRLKRRGMQKLAEDRRSDSINL